MKHKSHLFQLIKSLTKSEKRFFKLSSSIHGGDKNYSMLFQAMDKQKEYDKDKLCKAIKNKKIVENLPYEKNYLYNLILKSLNNYHAENSVDNRLKGMLRSIEELHKKGLRDQCMILVNKAKKTAAFYERHLRTIEILFWEQKLTGEEFDQENSKEFVEKFPSENEQAFRGLKEVMDCFLLQGSVIARYLKTGLIRKQEDMQAADKILNEQISGIRAEELSYDARRYFFNAFYIHSLLKGDYTSAYQYSRKLMEHIESHPHQVQEFSISYISAYNNMLICQKELEMYDELLESIQKMRNISSGLISQQTEEIKRMIFIFSFNLELSTYLETGEFDKGIACVPEVQKGFERFKENLSGTYGMIMQLNISIIYFGAGKYDLALAWLNKLLNNSGVKSREDMQAFARIFNLIIHYEKGNMDLLEYSVNTASYFLQKKNKLFKAEEVILRFVRKLLKRGKGKQLAETFQELQAEFKLLEQDPFEVKILSYFNFSDWIASKVENRSIAEMVKERLMKKQN